MTNASWKVPAWIALIFLACPAYSAEWGVVGAGNATCEHWGRANAATKNEIVSWMQGFATSESLSRAVAGSQEFRLELLTREYLNSQINLACSSQQNKNEHMSGILIGLLTKFPTHALAQTPSQSNDAINQDGVWYENTMGRDKLKYGSSMLICFPALFENKKFSDPKAPSTTDASCSIYLTNERDETIRQYYAYINPASNKVEFGAPENGTYIGVSKKYRAEIPKSDLLETHAKQWLDAN